MSETKFSNAYFKKLANQLMFDLTDEEIEELKQEFEIVGKQLQILEKIDTTNVEEMIYPFEAPTSYMREDEVEEVLELADVLANVPISEDEYVAIPRVVK